MLIAPVIFCTVVLGIAGMENMKAVGKTGALALLYFELLSSIALVIGLMLVNLLQPGRHECRSSLARHAGDLGLHGFREKFRLWHLSDFPLRGARGHRPPAWLSHPATDRLFERGAGDLLKCDPLSCDACALLSIRALATLGHACVLANGSQTDRR